MAGGLIGALRVTLGIDTAAFEAGAARAAGTARREAGAIESSFSKAAGGVRTAMASLVAGLSVGAIVAAASRALDYASSLDEVSQQLGVTSKDLQEYRYAATQVGISQEEMDKGLAKLTVTMGQARAGVEKPKAAFAELSKILGVDILKSAATAGDAIPLMADAFGKVTDPTKRAALEVEFFGKTGQKLDTLLAGGSAAVNQLRDAARDLGLVLSTEQIENADKTADKLSELKQVLEANIASAVANNAEAIYNLATSFEHLIVQIMGAISAWQNFNASGILNNPNQTALVSWLRGQNNDKIVGGAVRTLSTSASGRQILADRNKQQLSDLAAGNTSALGYDGRGIADNPQARAAERKRLLYEQQQIAAMQQRAAGANAKPKPSTGAGAGTSDAAAASAAAKAKAAAEKSAREAEQERKKTAKQIERYNSDLAGLQRDQYSAESDLTTDIEARAEFQRKRIALDEAAYRQDLDSKVALGELTATQAKRLLAGKRYNDGLELTLIDQKRDDELTKQALSVKDASLTLQSDLKHGELDEAKTQAERRTLQGQLLDIEYDRQKAALESVLALNSSTQAEKDIATARLAQLPTLKAQQAEGVRRDTAGPMEAFGDSLHRTAGQIKEDFQQIEVDGIKSLNDGLVDAIVNSRNLGDVFSSVAKQILSDLIKIGLQAAESSLFGKGAESGGGGFLGSLLSGITSIFGGGHTLGGSSISSSLFKGLSASNGIKGLAGGGIVQVGGSGGIDTNLMSINGMPAARVNRGEHIKVIPNNDNSNKPGTVHVVVQANDYFDARVEQVSGNVAATAVSSTEKARVRYSGRTMGGNGS